MEKANILVVGTSGAGKSTLINTVIGKEVAKVGMGKPGTDKAEMYESDELNFRLIDSRGFEYSYINTRKAVKDMKTWVRDGLKNPESMINMLWFCVDATSKRMTKSTVRTLELVKKEWTNVPIIIVLTKSFFSAEDEDNIAMVKENFRKCAKKTGDPIAIIPVLATPPKDASIVARGIEDLVKVTEDNLEDAYRVSEDAIKQFDLKCKRIKAHGSTAVATTSAAVVGAVPIDFPDATILVPIETSLITIIAKIYGKSKEDASGGKIIARIIEAGAVGIAAKSIINHLKLIPGVTNIAADVLNAIVAGAIVLGIGEASILIFEKAYLGEADDVNLDWIDDIVKNNMGKVVKKISKAIENNDGEIKAADILKAVFDDDSKTSK